MIMKILSVVTPYIYIKLYVRGTTHPAINTDPDICINVSIVIPIFKTQKNEVKGESIGYGET